ncbi:iron-containing alcohol dehydrogenase [Aquidulcibacter sp.]|uniref:iron-containing alcohol dehydrogenase n=1 Tax=Aquidulcibacter sp. TaxID=2052990 RepID=UPI0025C69C64|nr:iron-containing alcohol dehydrogenase [Aquidulcibacter sp.]MCA3697395.1 iron-containing alcohol dehydrogenase [Aquidulcibacter sp.]
MSLPNVNWNYPTSVRFGAGRISDLANACKSLGIARPLLVTDPGIVRLPMIGAAMGALKAAGLSAGLFSDVKPNPVGANVTAGVIAYKAGNHDGVIAWGGGSGLDAAKAIAFMSGQTRPLWDFEDIGDWYTRADPAGIAPIIAVPTTAGTGSEVGRASVILDEETHTKKIIFHPKFMPSIVILDPELTIGLPKFITAATGIDALSHCLEAFCAPGFHPMADGVALEGMRLIKDYLPRAVANGSDIDARGNMLVAASMGATAFQKGLGGMHALAHPIGALYDTHHGATNGVLMPYVLAFNKSAIEERIGRLAAYLDLPSHSFSGFMDWVLALREEIGIPHDLDGLKPGIDRLDDIAHMAEKDPSAGGNPVLFDAAAARTVLDQAQRGALS